VSDHFTEVTGCQSGDHDCAEAYLLSFAQQAFRRPLRDDEHERLSAVFAGLLAVDSSVTAERALEHGIAAVIHSPQFLYRSELGADGNAEGRLTAHEVASSLAYFVADAPPDPTLLEAAAVDALSTPEQIDAQVTRLLDTEAARASLESLMHSYFGYANVLSVVIDDEAFHAGVGASMFQEGRLFLRETLWSGPLDGLLLSRVGFANAALAPIYGLSQFPPPGASLDANQFARIELPAQRAGLLTQPALLASRSRPDGPSVVARGLFVNSMIVCAELDPPPEGVFDVGPLQGETPRQLAEARASEPVCNECHQAFDAYGLALERFDALGRYRESYANGASIDVAVTMPAEIGGGPARDIVDIARRLTEGGYFARCMTSSLFREALAESWERIDSCVVQRALADLDTGGASFSDLVRAVAKSEAFVNRRAPSGI
jgi:hypothetical protein